MFDPVTASLLRSAPELPGLPAESIPSLLTHHYAQLVSARLRGDHEDTSVDEDAWPLERIADTYELITSIVDDLETRRSSAFVAATAHQILSRKTGGSVNAAALRVVSRDGVHPSVAAALLFLAAEQYADASEAAISVVIPEGGFYEVRILAEDVRDLTRGQLRSVLDRASRWRRRERPNYTIQTQAFLTLIESLIAGVELLSADILSVPVPEIIAGRFDSARAAFLRVLQLSSSTNDSYSDQLGDSLFTSYAGPRHLASLLLAASDGIQSAALTKILPPDGADAAYWGAWLNFRADRFPFVWPNHREAIAMGFYQTGTSAVVVLPTGAGKTTVSSLKIAGTLARGKKVIFLAPTHALVEQLTDDLQEMFPKDILGAEVSSDFDMLLMANTQLQEIEVMTPERCLAMLSFAPEAFEDVGLLVFDECHLLSPQSGKIRRSLDGMLCVLAFNRMAPDADTLFLSAMVKNGNEFSEWIADLTNRPTVHVDLLWKPSRQARGVIIYRKAELDAIKKAAISVQKQKDKQEKKVAKGVRKAAEAELNAHPQAIWGLQHNWLSGSTAYCSFTAVTEDPVPLAGDIKYGPFRLRPNANQVAARLAATSALNGLKTIVFVNTKADAVSTATEISERIGETIVPTEPEVERWGALKEELGDLKHSLLGGATAAVPHNSAMLRLERDLAERMFRRSDGAKVIVATPTLAQGLNLPAQLAILAGDKRASSEKSGRELLEAHEILNAAARAGRAGHLANGVVLLVPEPIISFEDGKALDPDVVEKLRSVLPEDDRCVTISDPLEVVLDRLVAGNKLDREVLYTVNRMAILEETEGDDKAAPLFNLNRSLAAFSAKKKAAEGDFNKKIEILKGAIEESETVGGDTALAVLASQSGLPRDILERLRKRVADQIGSLPTTISDWVLWTLDWLSSDEEARSVLLFDVKGAVLAATGNKKTAPITGAILGDLGPGVLAWIAGQPLRELELILGGKPDSKTDTLRVLPRARELVSSVIPRGLSFITGLVSHVVEQLDPFDAQENLDRGLVEGLSTAVRRGFDTFEKLSFATENKAILGRVQVHKAWAKSQASLFLNLDDV